MNPEIKTLWIEALRSGEYEQGAGSLARGVGTKTTYHCCLGVLCEVLIKAGKGISKTAVPGDESYSFNGMSGYPGLEVLYMAGVEHRIATRLAHMNDNGRPFSAIADYIEREL